MIHIPDQIELEQRALVFERDILEPAPVDDRYKELAMIGLWQIVKHNSDYAYHNAGHAINVATIVLAMCNEEPRRTRRQTGNLLGSAILHDRYPESEEESAEAAVREMKAIGGFRERDFYDVGRFIQVTKNKRIDGAIVHSPKTRLERLLVEADMSSLGLPPEEFWSSSKLIYAEKNPGVELVGQALRDFLRVQIQLLSSFEFTTPEAKRLLPHRQENLAFVQEMLQAA